MEDKSLYIGYSKDISRRLEEHRKIFPKDEIIYYEAYRFDKDARLRERKLKQYGHGWQSLKKRINF